MGYPENIRMYVTESMRQCIARLAHNREREIQKLIDGFLMEDTEIQYYQTELEIVRAVIREANEAGT